MMQHIEMDFVIFSFSNWVVVEEEEDQMAQKGLTPLKRGGGGWLRDLGEQMDRRRASRL